jgi:hypothetical protein
MGRQLGHGDGAGAGLGVGRDVVQELQGEGREVGVRRPHLFGDVDLHGKPPARQPRAPGRGEYKTPSLSL